jgi:putative redox protein
MEIIVDFPGGSRVNAQIGPHTITTDQPKANGGEDTGPTPFEIFLGSLATCAGFYVLGFCKMRNIPSAGIRLIQKVERDPETKMARKVVQEIQLPPEFPEQYIPAVKRAAETCLVKKHMDQPPAFEITATIMPA